MEFLHIAWAYKEMLLVGAATTAVISGASILLGMPLGLAFAFGLVSHNRPIRLFCAVYRSFWRGTPLLVQILLVFYLLPSIGLDLSPVTAAVLALILNTSAFQAEIFRGGLSAVPKGQVEAAQMLGIAPITIRRRIVIPQLLRLVTPAITNEFISILKNSSIISVISVTELLRTGQQIVSATYRPLEVYGLIAIIYIVMNLVIAQLGRRAEARLARGARA
ncbi:polar amino acid transport system permease protein [Aminobacter niigataensis]|uniref:Polar amino acid transport system permease protein n=2 Tax=Aminobacter niigataensis TaxID=83265 RepID=A0ABR6L3Y6_9HYPH|nr:amino acid ABC transporter permease [Aminobacter niigataensis]MBB4651492.1 polar amino acid transport system permease protein [Aminobacter niigataensis]